MKWLLPLLFVLACGAAGSKKDKDKPASEPCTVEDVEGGVLMTCPDGTTAFLPNGRDGDRGEQGVPGRDGKDAPMCRISRIVYECSDGSERSLE